VLLTRSRQRRDACRRGRKLLTTKVTDGILGSFTINSNGDTNSNPVTIYQIKGGKQTTYKTITPPLDLVKGRKDERRRGRATSSSRTSVATDAHRANLLDRRIRRAGSRRGRDDARRLLLLWLSVNLAKTPSDFASVALEG
jgi:hypothetical protein